MDREKHIELRRVFTHLYGSSADARRIVYDAGLPADRIDFSGSSVNIWHSILTEAERRNALGALVIVALEDYPNHEELASFAAVPMATEPERTVTRASEPYDLFMSTSNLSDRLLGPRLVANLRALGLRIFDDNEHIVPGRDLLSVIEMGVEDSLGAIILLNARENMLGRGKDLYGVIRRFSVRKRGFRIIPARLDDSPLPDYLADLQALDLRGLRENEPLDLAATDALRRLAAVMERARRGEVEDPTSDTYAQMLMFATRLTGGT